mmetsp:Transcript_15872/g.25235  ORF Transcript_15872/g.25235 Transcript_15872/m.25235 type:complete len:431 (+) Transcript_15872:137-1429(+)
MYAISRSILMYLSLFVSSALKPNFLDAGSAAESALVETSSWHWSSLNPGLPAVESMTTFESKHARRAWQAPKAEPMSIRFIRDLHGKPSYSRMIQAFLILLVIVGFIVGIIMLAQSDPHDISSDPPNASTMNMRQRIKASPPLSLEDLQVAMEGCDGSWARMYKRVPMNELESLELLFRCGLVPVQDFEVSSVPTDHIDECVGIAKSMLQEKPLDAWVESWAEAIQVFEESKTARHSIREDASEERISDLAIGIGQLHAPENSVHLTSPSNSALSLRESKDIEAIRRTVPAFGRSSAMPSNSNIDPSLLSRCREIMSQYKPRSRRDLESVPVDDTRVRSAPATAPETEDEHIVKSDREEGAPQQDRTQPTVSSPSKVKLNAYERFPTETQISSSSGQIYTGNITYDASHTLQNEETSMESKGGTRDTWDP